MGTTGVAITRVFTNWRDASSFKRISEYFTGRENTGNETVVRTHPEERGGFYFLARVINSGAARPVKISLQIVAANEAKTRIYALAAELKAGQTMLNIGVTGPDWIDPRANPVAWKLELASADGQPLASEKSYVWDKPTGHP